MAKKKTKKTTKTKKVKKKEDKEGIFIPAGLLAGIGLGMLTEQVAAGALIGLACGFIVYGVIKLVRKK